MDNFNFYNPTRINFGKGTIQNIGREIKKDGIDKILLLAGRGSIKDNSVYEQVTKSLQKAGVQWEELWGVRPNPTLEHANKAIGIVKANGLQAILAVGGGSVIDEAKSIAVGVYLNNLWNAFEKIESIEKALPVFTVLTLSGTASEMDPLAVLSNEEEKKKWNIGSELIYPKVSIIDPSIQMSLPWHQTVNGSIDAISHIMEYYFVGTDEEATIGIAESLMKTIIKCVDSLQKDQMNYPARANIAWSATLALNGIAGAGLKGGDWSVHRIEHGISALHPEVAHGAGLAVVFPAWMRFMQNYNPAQFQRWAKNVWNSNSTDEGIETMKNTFRRWGSPVSLKELGIHKNEIEAIAENCIRMGRIGYFTSLTYETALEILKIAYE